MAGITCGGQVFEHASNLRNCPIVYVAGWLVLPRNINEEVVMSHLTRFFAFIFLTMLCFKGVNAQEPDTNREASKTIPHAEVITLLLNFSEQLTEECKLPCFANIRPDETTLSEIQGLSIDLFDEDESILAQFDKPFEREDGLVDYTLVINDNEDIEGFFDIGFLVSQDGLLHRFKAHLFQPENWLESTILDISVILGILGTPDEIHIAIVASQPPQFSIVLGYKTLGTVFLYTYRFKPEQLTQSGEPIPLCGSWSRTYSVNVWIQAIDEDSYNALLLENLRIGESESLGETVYSAFWPLERITNWNIEDWAQFLVENPEWCFDALSYEELLEAGYSY